MNSRFESIYDTEYTKLMRLEDAEIEYVITEKDEKNYLGNIAEMAKKIEDISLTFDEANIEFIFEVDPVKDKDGNIIILVKMGLSVNYSECGMKYAKKVITITNGQKN